MEQFEAFLDRTVPTWRVECRGASEQEIAELESVAGQPLPPFYHWFLRTMGRQTGPLTTQIDMSIGKALELNRAPDADRERGFAIGYHDYDIGDAIWRYDLTRQVRGDAAVLAAGNREYEALCDWLGWVASRRLFRKFAKRCRGMFLDHLAHNPSVAEQLTPLVKEQAFSSPYEMGEYFRVFERADAVLVTTASPTATRNRVSIWSFDAAGSKRRLVQLFDEIAAKTDVCLEVSGLLESPIPGQFEPLEFSQAQRTRWRNEAQRGSGPG